jgi:hypothetical protein
MGPFGISLRSFLTKSSNTFGCSPFIAEFIRR